VEAAAELWPAEPDLPGTPPHAPASPMAFDGGEEPRPAPEVETIERRPTGKLVLNTDLEPTSVEQYRRMAARLHLAQAQQGTKLVMVTSALVGEGKTLTATNLALTLSESYKKRVLLIDADLRRPGVHELFRIPNFTGLNDGIRSDEDRKVPVIRVTDRLSVLTAGRPDPDPMSVLSSDRMRRVLADAAAAFEWVVIDTPPVALLSDAHLLAMLVDTVVLVVRAGVTPLQAIQKAAQAVGRDRVLGVVLNGAARAPRSVYHYYSPQVAVTVAK
jgi:capsular exopolysaccharide synthesis family protein